MIVRPLLACIIVAGLFSCTGRRAQRTDLALEADQQSEPQVASGEDDENQGPPKELFTSKSNYYTKRHFAKLHQKLDEETRWHIERSKSSEILADEFFQENKLVYAAYSNGKREAVEALIRKADDDTTRATYQKLCVLIALEKGNIADAIYFYDALLATKGEDSNHDVLTNFLFPLVVEHKRSVSKAVTLFGPRIDRWQHDLGSLTDLLYIDAGFLSSAEVMETFSCVLRWYLEADVTWSDSEFEIMERRMSDIIRYFESHGRAADLEKIGLGIQALNFHSKRQPKDATARIEVLGGVP